MVKRLHSLRTEKSYEPIIAIFSDGSIIEYTNAKEAANDLLTSEHNIRGHLNKNHRFNNVRLYFKSIYDTFIKNKKNGNKEDNA